MKMIISLKNMSIQIKHSPRIVIELSRGLFFQSILRLFEFLTPRCFIEANKKRFVTL